MYHDGGKLVLSATDLVTELACRHYTSLSLEVAGGRRRNPDGSSSETMSVVQRRGMEHEARYLARLAAEGLDPVEIALDGRDLDDLRAAELATAAAMRAGADIIYQATFFDESGRAAWRGHADFLRRVDGLGPSGAHRYEPEDTKLAAHVKPGAILQLCHYAEHITRLQGIAPDRIHVVLGDDRTETYPYRDFEAYYRQARDQFVDLVLSGGAHTYPLPVPHCVICEWNDTCTAQREADDHLTLVAGLTREQARKLEAVGVATLSNLAGQSDDLRVRGIGAQTLQRLQHQARLQKRSRQDPDAPPPVELLAPSVAQGLQALPPPTPGDLFFDIEGDPFVGADGLEYLLGVGWLDAEQLFKFRPFWAHTSAEEKRSFEAFIDFVMARLETCPDLHIYHYAPYEPAALGKLMGRYATREAEVDRLLRGRVLVDLYRVVRQSMLVGSASYSIKKLEPLYMPAREAAIVDAGSSIDEYERWLEEGDQSILDDIEEYNRDDCLSTQLLRDWLEARRPEAESRFGVELTRPGLADATPSVGVSEEASRVGNLSARLTARSLVDGSVEEDDDPLQLLAHLLGWHRREEKPAWWQYFHRALECTDQDLVDDTESIGELAYVGVVGEEKQSLIHRYSFDPDQEHKISAGSKIADPRAVRLAKPGEQGPPSPGSVVAVDTAAGLIDLKRGKSSTVEHPKSLIPGGPIGTEVLRDALYRFGSDVADRGLEAEGPGRAGRDLLVRHPPRIVGVDPGQPLRPDTAIPTVEAAVDLGLRLDRGCLPIQGPPGAGKTHTAAHMIVALVRAGKRVGITANSHAVITNLLGKVMKVAADQDVDLRAMQKPDSAGEGGCEHERVKIVTTNQAIDGALAAGAVDVIAGTAWLFARPETDAALDVLIIDEAGQMSLANALAVSGAADNLILVGDPQQLAQPSKGVQPPGAERSALEHLLDGRSTVAESAGLFLDHTYRLHPEICRYISALAYDGRLESMDQCALQVIESAPRLGGSGLRWMPVAHDGDRTCSVDEAEAVAGLYQSLLGRAWTDEKGHPSRLGADDILIVAPYNAQVNLLIEHLPPGARVGTVDKFQGQEGAVVIVSLAASSADDVPRGMEFLYSKNRLNVAVSRARALAVVVASPALLTPNCRTVEQMRLANGLCLFAEMASRIDAE